MIAKKCCDKLANCPFFEAVKETVGSSGILDEYKSAYCCGPLREQCHRLQHLDKYGRQPEKTLAPSGKDYKKSF